MMFTASTMPHAEWLAFTQLNLMQNLSLTGLHEALTHKLAESRR